MYYELISIMPKFTYDADAQAFITASGITDNTQKLAINQLVLDLKGYNIWSKMKFIYPFVGGTATTHKWNLINPLDTNAAFRLSFVGGWTHSNNGALPNGTNAYANTFFVPNTQLNNNNFHLSYYSRTQNSGSQIEMAAANGGYGLITGLSLLYAGNGKKWFYNTSLAGTIAPNSTTTNTKGLQIGSKTSSTLSKLYFNNNIESTITVSNTNTLTVNNLYLGALNLNNSMSDLSSKQVSFASAGDGLTDTEASNLYTAVQAFQTTLGRQV